MTVRVLVIDDDPTTSRLLSLVFEMEGWEAHEARDAYDAVEQISLNPPTLIVTDLIMPMMDEFALINNLQKANESSRIPVIVYSSKVLSLQEIAMLEGRVHRILDKNMIDYRQLVHEIKGILSDTELHQDKPA